MKDIVYITAHCIPQDEGYGVIVNEQGYIRESKADDIWKEKENASWTILSVIIIIYEWIF